MKINEFRRKFRNKEVCVKITYYGGRVVVFYYVDPEVYRIVDGQSYASWYDINEVCHEVSLYEHEFLPYYIALERSYHE